MKANNNIINTLKNEMINTLKPLTFDELVEVTEKVFTDTTIPTNLIWNMMDSILAELETRMSEEDFINYCKKLESF